MIFPGIYASQISGHLLPTSGFVSLATINGSGSTLTFSSIPSIYTHLQIRASVQSGRTSNAYDGFNIQLNSDTGSNYAYHQLFADNRPYIASGGASSQTSINVSNIAALYGTSNVTSALVMDILDYTNTNKYKTVRILTGYDTNQSGIISGGAGIESGLWQSTSVINSITLFGAINGFTNKTQFALYGVK